MLTGFLLPGLGASGLAPWGAVALGPRALPPSSPFYFITMFIIVYYCYYSTELPALCDGCLGWGWVWRAGLVAGLRVGQAFGMFLLPGFGVGSSSPWVPGHPTSMCDSGVNIPLTNLVFSVGTVSYRSSIHLNPSSVSHNVG